MATLSTNATIVPKHLPYSVFQLTAVVHIPSTDAVSTGYAYKVGIAQRCLRETTVIEKILPLAHIAEVIIIQHNNFDIYIILHNSAELLHCHLKTSVAKKCHYGAVGAAYFAPMAAGRPKPIVPRPPDDMKLRGREKQK